MDTLEQLTMRLSAKYPQQADPNPMIRTYGYGPDGVKCKACKHLYYRQFQNRYYKCELRGKPTGGPGTDHRVGWKTCSKFEVREDGE